MNYVPLFFLESLELRSPKTLVIELRFPELCSPELRSPFFLDFNFITFAIELCSLFLVDIELRSPELLSSPSVPQNSVLR